MAQIYISQVSYLIDLLNMLGENLWITLNFLVDSVEISILKGVHIDYARLSLGKPKLQFNSVQINLNNVGRLELFVINKDYNKVMIYTCDYCKMLNDLLERSVFANVFLKFFNNSFSSAGQQHFLDVKNQLINHAHQKFCNLTLEDFLTFLSLIKLKNNYEITCFQSDGFVLNFYLDIIFAGLAFSLEFGRCGLKIHGKKNLGIFYEISNNASLEDLINVFSNFK